MARKTAEERISQMTAWWVRWNVREVNGDLFACAFETIFKKECRVAWKEHSHANDQISLCCKFFIRLGEMNFERDIDVTCPKRERKTVNVVKESYGESYYYEIEKQDFAEDLQNQIMKLQKDFWMTENELIESAHKLMDADYSSVHFKQQVEINHSIIDGIAFCKDYLMGNKFLIVGFEAKTDKDNYGRLFGQINSYLAICDMVYLVVQNKEIPKDLPFFVGVISSQSGKGEILRRAYSLKHSVEAAECWNTMLHNLEKHVGLGRGERAMLFFDAIETIKKKLIWNQFVVGFHRAWHEDYIPLTPKEKRLIKTFFGKDTPLQKFITEE